MLIFLQKSLQKICIINKKCVPLQSDLTNYVNYNYLFY